MNARRSDLVIRLDEEQSRFLFFFRPRRPVDEASDAPDFAVDIPFDELWQRGPDGAEKLIGESVLGVFDTLTNGRLNLPRHYSEDGPGSNA